MFVLLGASVKIAIFSIIAPNQGAKCDAKVWCLNVNMLSNVSVEL